MSAKDKTLCEKCHEHPATRHICCAHNGETQHLCETCFQESASPEQLATDRQIKDIIRNGKCMYCGGPAAGGSVSFTPDLDKTKLWCKQCSLDLKKFHKMPENALDFPSEDEAAQERFSQQFDEREKRKEEFMKQRISERKPKGNGKRKS